MTEYCIVGPDGTVVADGFYSERTANLAIIEETGGSSDHWVDFRDRYDEDGYHKEIPE